MKFIVHFLSLATGAHSAASEGVYPKLSARMETLRAQHFKTRHVMAAKKLQLQSANTLRNFKPAFVQQDNVECDWWTEETCYDDQYNAIGCEPYASGGCPCPDGQEKCGAVPELSIAGYCTEPEICCTMDEELCYDEAYNPTNCVAIAAGGCPCPDGQEKCGAAPEWNYAGYCTEPQICCTADEELCYDEAYNPTNCEAIATGGCLCPDGQEKCGAIPEWSYAGYCTEPEICCTMDEELCYDEAYNPTNCEAIATGGCPCPDGQEKCGAIPEWSYAGYCTTLCCAEDQETCYDESFTPTSCESIDAGGCPCPDGQVKCGADPELGLAGFCTSLCCEEQTCYDMTSWEPTSCASWTEVCPSDITYNKQKGNIIAMLNRSGMKKEAAELRMINAKKAKLMSMNHADQKVINQLIKAEEFAILRKTKHGSHEVVDKDVPAFMLMLN